MLGNNSADNNQNGFNFNTIIGNGSGNNAGTERHQQLRDWL